MTRGCNIVMIRVMEHWDDRFMEHCDDKGRENGDDRGHGAL